LKQQLALQQNHSFFYNEKYKLFITCLIRDYSLEKVRESRQQMMIHHSINHHQNKNYSTNVLYKHLQAARGNPGVIKSGVKSPTKANTDHYYGVFK